MVTPVVPHVFIAAFLSAGVVIAPALTLACYAAATAGWLIGLTLGGAGTDDPT